jgi:hypothetical protein
LGSFVAGYVLYLGRFEAWVVLCFGTFCSWNFGLWMFVLGHFVLGNFVLGCFVGVPEFHSTP